MTALPSITAVLPAYDEIASIEDVVVGVHRALQRCAVPDFEVIVVDDGSRDGTGAAVARLASALASLRLITHRTNRGYGAALRSGFDAATKDAVWLLDSDGQFDPDDLPLLLDRWTPGVFVAGVREERRDPIARRLSNRAFFTVVRLSMGPVASDVNCAFKLFPAHVGQGLAADGAMISTELLLRARRSGLRIVEVPVPHHPRTAGRSSGASPRVVLRAFGELYRLRRGQSGGGPPPGALLW